MLRRLIELSVVHRTLVLLLALAAAIAGALALQNLRVDALPDSSDVQVIVVADFPGQASEVVDDQVTLPLTADLLRVPGATDVRGLSMFGQAFVYVLFADGTDLYWARSRVLEQLSVATRHLPEGVVPYLGPDATGVGWVYQYILYPGFFCPKHRDGLWHDEAQDRWYGTREEVPGPRRGEVVHVHGSQQPDTCPLDGKPRIAAALDLAQLRSLQDWTLRYPLSSVAGVAEVATIGGFVRQYQVVVNPELLQLHGIALAQVTEAIRRSNADVGASVIEQSEREYMIRGRGALRSVEDLAHVVVGHVTDHSAASRPLLLRDVASVQLGGESRRGVGEYNGIGEAVGAVVIARYGENSNQVIAAVKAKLTELEEGLPPGVLVVPTYDRSALIGRAVGTLTRAVFEELIVVALVCLLFLSHARSALVAVVTLPIALLMSIAAMQLAGINANIMSLGGLALAIGVMVDSAIVMVENAHRRLDTSGLHASDAPPQARLDAIVQAAQEVGPSLFAALLIIALAFLPLFALGEQSGRLFRPLAYTKTFAMLAAAGLGVTLVPALMAVLLRGHIPRESTNPLNRAIMAAYAALFRRALRYPWLTLATALLLGLSTIFPLQRLGEELMPPLQEGDLLYMPTTQPGISLTKSKELLQQTDKLMRTFPEVISVHGKIGRADTATDPAPLSMIESLVQLAEPQHWRQRTVARVFASWPAWVKWPLVSTLWPETRPIHLDELKYGWTDADGTHHPGLNEALSLPGVSNAWPAPIEGRLNMLSTGMKTPVGVKIMGPDIAILDQLAEQTALALRQLPRTISAHAERTLGGLHLDVEIDRQRTAAHGLNTGEVQEVLETAIGGKTITTVVQGGERYPLSVRYPPELRDDPEDLAEVMIKTPDGRHVPLRDLTSISIHAAPDMIRSEDGQRSAWVFVDTAESDLGGYVAAARSFVDSEAPLPPGYNRVWSGRFEQLQATKVRLRLVIPLTLVLIVLLLYATNQSWFRVGLVLLAVPFSLIGALWLLWFLGYNLSLAVWVGILALLGLDAETGQIMLLYLDSSFETFRQQGRMRHRGDLYDSVFEGAVRRIRPKTMSVGTAILGLLPLLWATGTGADLTRRIVAPMIGGLTVSFAMELLIYPVVFFLFKGRHLPADEALANNPI